MAIDRRDMLRGLAAAMAFPVLPAGATARERELFAAALREANGDYAAVIFSLGDGVVSKAPLPARGHACAVRPGTGECIAFARRPGTFAVAFARDGRKPFRFAARGDRHFYGHGAFSPDGRLLYTTENDYDGRRGMIGVRDASGGYAQVGEFPSGGTGPHDLAIMPDGRTLVVANGGIETHPDFGRDSLNLETMSPSLSYIDALNGEVLETHALPNELHQVSIRHLCVAGNGHVAFGCQHKGPRNLRPMLLGLHRRGETLRLLDIPGEANDRLNGYVGSVCADAPGEIVAATSPRGGVALYLDVAGKRFLGFTPLADACGVAGRRDAPGFLLTSGTGGLALARPDRLGVLRQSGAAWDNHVSRV